MSEKNLKYLVERLYDLYNEQQLYKRMGNQAWGRKRLKEANNDMRAVIIALRKEVGNE